MMASALLVETIFQFASAVILDRGGASKLNLERKDHETISNNVVRNDLRFGWVQYN